MLAYRALPSVGQPQTYIRVMFLGRSGRPLNAGGADVALASDSGGPVSVVASSLDGRIYLAWSDINNAERTVTMVRLPCVD